MNSKGKIGILKLPNRGNLNSIKDALEYCDGPLCIAGGIENL